MRGEMYFQKCCNVALTFPNDDPFCTSNVGFLLILRVIKSSYHCANFCYHFCAHDINTAQKMQFSIKDFFSKCDQIRNFLRIWSHLLKKSLTENCIFSAMYLRVEAEERSSFFLVQKQSPIGVVNVFCLTGLLKNFAKFTGKHVRPASFIN